MKRIGPKQKTIKDKRGNGIVFRIKNKKLSLIGRIRGVSGMTFTDAQVRGLRNWLNWYLDNK